MRAGDVQAREAIAATGTEREFSDAIVDLARLLGWRVHRDPTWRATGADAGWPDLCLLKDGHLIFAELKLDKAASRLSEHQQGWITALEAVDTAAVLVTVWRPSQWPEIEQILQGHQWCADEFHRCDGGGIGESARYNPKLAHGTPHEPGRDESHGMEMQ